MNVHVDWFGFVEDVAHDARGMPTLVGFSPKVQVCSTLPATLNYNLVLSMDDDEDEPVFVEGRLITLELRVLEPDGTVMIGTTQTNTIGPPKFEGVPGSITAIAGAAFEFRRYGRYRAEATVTISDTDVKLEAHRDLYITGAGGQPMKAS